MKVKIIKCSRNYWWYADQIGQIFDVVQHNLDSNAWALLEDDPNFIEKSDCEIIPEDGLIDFDWEKYKTGNYDALFGGSPVLDILKSTKSQYYVVLVGLRQAHFNSGIDLQLRPKVVEKYLNIYGEDLAVISNKPVKAENLRNTIKLTYDSLGILLKAEII